MHWGENIGTREDANAIGVWGVIAGVIGARAYHVFTDWERFEGNWGDVVKVWEGGLGIPGGMLAGVLVGVYVAHRRGIPLGPGLNAVAPCLPLAQAIGRWGNYFNQELYGKPTDLPWALEIDAEHLLLACQEGARGQTLIVDMPEPNEAALRMADAHGMQRTFATARMYRNGRPDLPIERIFGITTFELG